MFFLSRISVFRRWDKARLRSTLMVLIACTALFLAGCGAIKVPVAPYVGKISVEETLPVEAALLITEEAASYIYRGKPSSDPFARPFEYPLGEALQKASVDAFSQVFKKVVLVHTIDDAKNYKVVVKPEIKDFSFGFPRHVFVAFAVSRIKVKVSLYSGETKIWEKTVESPEQKRTIKKIDWSDFGESASAALVYTLKKIAEEISRDVSVRRLVTNDKNITEEIEKYKHAIRINPDDAEAHYNLGLAYLNSGRLEEAIEEFKEVVRIKPDFADANIILGVAYADLGKHSESIEIFKEVIRTNPNNEMAHFSLGLAYSHSGRLEEAIEEFKEVVRINPNNAGAHLRLGAGYMHVNDKDSALEEYNILKDLHPEMSILLLQIIKEYELESKSK